MSALINKDGVLLPIDSAQNHAQYFIPSFNVSSRKSTESLSVANASLSICRGISDQTQPYYTEVVIPAYTNSGEGINVHFDLYAYQNRAFSLILNTQGAAASALRKNFLRTLSILTALKQSWTMLLGFHFELITCNDRYLVKDARSAGLPLVIALLNILHLSQGLQPPTNLIGTGILRMDGSFTASSSEAEKRAVTETVEPGKIFLDSNNCAHVFDLNKYFS